CPFKTITHAIQVIGTQRAAVAIDVKATGTVQAGEQFPIVVPAYFQISGVDSAGVNPATVTVVVPTGASGFTLAAAPSSIDHLTITGLNGGQPTGVNGVIVDTGSQPA